MRLVDITVKGQLATPIQVKAEATVTDLENNELSATSDFIVHPSELCVGLRLEREYVRAETPVCFLRKFRKFSEFFSAHV